MDKRQVIRRILLSKLKESAKKLTEKETESFEKELNKIKTKDTKLNKAIHNFSKDVSKDYTKITKNFWNTISNLPILTDYDIESYYKLMEKHIKPVFDKYHIPIKWNLKEFEDTIFDYQENLPKKYYEGKLNNKKNLVTSVLRKLKKSKEENIIPPYMQEHVKKYYEKIKKEKKSKD